MYPVCARFSTYVSYDHSNRSCRYDVYDDTLVGDTYFSEPVDLNDMPRTKPKKSEKARTLGTASRQLFVLWLPWDRENVISVDEHTSWDCCPSWL